MGCNQIKQTKNANESKKRSPPLHAKESESEEEFEYDEDGFIEIESKKGEDSYGKEGSRECVGCGDDIGD